MAKTRKKKHRNSQRRRGGVLGMVLCFLLGLIIGFGGFAGGILSIGAFLYKQPVDKTIATIEQYIPVDLYGTLFGKDGKDGYFNEKYATLKVTDLLGDSFDAIGALADGGSLSALNEVSPKIGALVDKLLKKTDKYAIPLEKDTLMNTALNKIPQYLGDKLKEIPLGDLLRNFDMGDEPLIMAISYGEEGVDYTIDANGDVTMLGAAKKTTVNDLLSGGFDSVLDKLTLDSIMTIDPSNSMMCTLAYGSSNRYTVDGDGKIQMTQITYTYEDRGDGYKLYNDKDEAVSATVETIAADTLKVTLENGSVQYVSLTAGVGLAFNDEALTTPVNYKKVRLSDVTSDAMALIDEIYLKDALSVDAKAHKVLISLAYGAEGVDFNYVGEGDNKTIEMIGSAKPRTIGELRTRGGNLINEIPLSDIMYADTENALVMYLLYGREGIHYAVNTGGEIVMLQKQIAIRNNAAYNEYGEALSGYTLDTANSYFAFNDKEYNYVASGLTLETADGTADIYYLTDMEGSAVYFERTMLGDMAGSNNIITSLTKRITLKDVIDEETMNSNLFFKHVQNETIETLPKAINNLTLQDVYENDIYKTDSNGNFLDKNGNITTNKEDYVVKGIWWYLLHDAEKCSTTHVSCDGKCIENYNITELSKLVPNMQENVHLSTLNDLSSNGLVQFSGSTLTSPIKTQVTIPGVSTIYVYVTDKNGNKVLASEAFAGKTTLGSLTVEEILKYVDGIINVFSVIEG